MRIFLIGLTVLYAAGAFFAQSVMTRPGGCVVAADAERYVASSDVETGDLNPWRSTAPTVQPVIDVTVGDAPDAERVFARFAVNSETGAALNKGSDPCRE